MIDDDNSEWENNLSVSNDIKAIETEYDGHRFRSRLEARWAVFFNAIGHEHDIPSSNIVTLAEALETTPDYLLLGKTEEESWMNDVIRVLGSIQDPAMRKLALNQLKCIASV